MSIQHLLTLPLGVLLLDPFVALFSNREKNLSPENNNNPPPKRPIKATSQAFIPKLVAISIDGLSNDQKDAAIITPAAKPSIASKTFLFIFLKQKTSPAPIAVILQVKSVAIMA